MSPDEVYARLTEVFHDLFGDDSIVLRPDMTADDVEGWDSFTHLNLIVAVEGTFGIKLQSGEIDGLKSVGDLVSLIERKTRAG